MSLDLDQAANTLNALAEPARLRLVALLLDGELTVTELTEATQMSQPRVSRHLKILVGADILQRFREAHWVYYRVRLDGEGASLARSALAQIDSDNPDFAADARRLAGIMAERTANLETDPAQSALTAEPELTSGEWSAVEQAMRRLAARTRQSSARGVGDLLDVGTGSGRLLEVLAHEAHRAEGIDNSSEMRQEARAALRKSRLANTHVRQGDMYHLPYDDFQFDTVLFGSMLAEATDPHQAITEAVRVMRVGGHLLVVELLPERDTAEQWSARLNDLLRAAELELLVLETLPLHNATAVLSLSCRRGGLETRVDLAIA